MTKPTENQDVEQQRIATQEALDAQAAFEDAGDHIGASVAAGDAGENARPVERPKYTRDEIRALVRENARRQRVRGEEEFARVYPNTMVVSVPISLGDRNIASSALRFLGAFDRVIHLLNTFGHRYMKPGEINALRESIHVLVSVYADEARQVLEQGRELVTKGRDGFSGLWLEPTWTTKTMDRVFNVKARDTMPLVVALHTWDAAILEFSTLNFNGLGGDDQINALRERERKLFTQLNKLSRGIYDGLQRRNDEQLDRAKEATGETAASGEDDSGAGAQSATDDASA